MKQFKDYSTNWYFPKGTNDALRAVHKVITYQQFLRWLAKPVGRADQFRRPVVQKPELDLFYIYGKKWNRLANGFFQNTSEEKRRINTYMDRLLEPSELLVNAKMMANMLKSVNYRLPDQPIPAHKVKSWKEFLANIVLLTESALESKRMMV